MPLARLLPGLGAPWTLGPDLPVGEARDQLRAWRRPALPVLAGGRLLGVVTPASLTGCSKTGEAAQPVPELDVAASTDQGRQLLGDAPALAVVNGGTFAGLLSPADLAPPVRPDLAARVWAALRPEDAAFLRRLAALAGPTGRLALVGGAVRDALLGERPLDLDLSLSGRPALDLAERSGLPFVFHSAYGNATLSLPDGRYVDLVQARMESYPQPGGAPEVRPGTLADDLARRDFAVNTVALPLDGEPGGLLDPCGGLADLEERILRPLHVRSFTDDASRLVRAARLATRLNFRLHPDGLAQVPDALMAADHTPRLWQELKLALGEPRPGAVLEQLDRWGAAVLLPSGARARLTRLDARRDAGEDATEVVYAAALLHGLPDAAGWSARLGLGERPLRLLDRAQGERAYPAGSAEAQLRSALNLRRGPLLSGADLLALGVPAGPAVGRALAHVAELVRSGQVTTREEALEALRSWPEFPFTSDPEA